MNMWLAATIGAWGAMVLIGGAVLVARAWRFYTNDADDIDWDGLL